MQSDTGSPHERIAPVCPPSRIGVALFFGLFEVAFRVTSWRAGRDHRGLPDAGLERRRGACVKHSPEHHPRQAPWFYGSLTVMLHAGGALVASGIDLVSLSIAAGVLNALLPPLVLGFLYRLARTALPEALRLRGAYAALAGLSFVVVSGVGLYAGIAGLLG